MATLIENDARVDFQLSRQAKDTIEQAAAVSGQSLSDFALAVLLEKAQQVLEATHLRSLSERDARIFLDVLDAEATPNQALRDAAAWYKEHHGNSLAD